MSEPKRMTEEALVAALAAEVSQHKSPERRSRQRAIFWEAEALRARASEAEKDKEIERLNAMVETLQRNRDSADADFASLSYALATRGAPLPECRSAGGIVIASTVRDLRAANAEALRLMRGEEERRIKAEAQVDTLIQGQQRNGEARQQARLDMAHELAEMEPAARDAALRRIIDSHEDKP